MTNHLKSTRRPWTYVLLAVGLLVFAGAPIAAAPDSSDSYTWSAELVAFDEMANTVTVKSLVVGRDMKDWSALSEGDRVMLTWSGVFTASGVRRVAKEITPDAGGFTMPVEFVSSEMDGRYVVFRVPVPERAVDDIRALKPSEWVTATTPHNATGETQVVTAIRPYTSVG